MLGLLSTLLRANLRIKIKVPAANKLIMRLVMLAAASCALLVGCAPKTFPTQAQSDAAYKAVHENKSESIVPQALAGMWVGEKGSVITFGPGHAATAHLYNETGTTKGQYRLEGTKLFLNDKPIAWLGMLKPHVIYLATGKQHVEHFNLVAQG